MLFSDAVFNIFAGDFDALNDVRQNVAVVLLFLYSIIPTSMLLFVSVCCYEPRCYYSCLYVVMRNLDAIIRVCMLLCETSMLLFYEAVFISMLSCQLSSFFVQNFVQTTSTLCKERRQLCTKNVNFARTTTT